MHWIDVNILHDESCCFNFQFFSLQFTKWPQILISMLQGQYTVVLQKQCPSYLVATTPESLLQQEMPIATVALSHNRRTVALLMLTGGRTGPCCGLHRTAESKRGLLAATHTESAGWVQKVNSGDLQPLICIVNITIAQVFLVKPWQGTDKGNLLDEARWRLGAGGWTERIGARKPGAAPTLARWWGSDGSQTLEPNRF